VVSSLAFLEHAFGAMVRERVSALLVFVDGMFFYNRARVDDLALRSRLPSMVPTSVAYRK